MRNAPFTPASADPKDHAEAMGRNACRDMADCKVECTPMFFDIVVAAIIQEARVNLFKQTIHIDDRCITPRIPLVDPEAEVPAPGRIAVVTDAARSRLAALYCDVNGGDELDLQSNMDAALARMCGEKRHLATVLKDAGGIRSSLLEQNALFKVSYDSPSDTMHLHRVEPVDLSSCSISDLADILGAFGKIKGSSPDKRLDKEPVIIWRAHDAGDRETPAELPYHAFPSLAADLSGYFVRSEEPQLRQDTFGRLMTRIAGFERDGFPKDYLPPTR